jgi:hypothetical protein
MRISGLLRALGAGSPILAMAFMGHRLPTALRVLLTGVAVAATAAVIHHYFTRAARISPGTIARHLDRTVPAMEDSAELLLIPEHGLNLLESLQRARVTERLTGLDGAGILPRSSVNSSAGLLAASFLVTLVIVAGAGGPLARTLPGGTNARLDHESSSDDDAPAISGIRVRIEPPAYTGLLPRESESLDFAAEEGAIVSWTVAASGPVDGALLAFEDDEIPMAGSSGDGFTASLAADGSRIYRLLLTRHGETVVRSAHARLKMIPDSPPVVSIISPAGSHEGDPTVAPALVVEVDARDDYGLTGASVVTTLARGSGENVQFRQRHLPLGGELSGSQQRLSRAIDLEELGMAPGSELYLHVETRDNRLPEPNVGRSATITITMPGAANPSISLGRGLPMLDPPGFLRSQRQIILDTEKLIAEMDSLRPEEFQFRSRVIGRDQSLLRVRYGSLLGEEIEDGRAVDVDEELDDADPAEEEESAGSSTASIYPEEFTHLHDSEESAAFFPDPVRRAFRGMLEQMWAAEGHLRTYRPEDALPFEYEALRLLKSVQEQSRAYVQKVGFETSPLNPGEDRLSGDLSGIKNQRDRRRGRDTLPAPEVRRALGFVRGLAGGPTSIPSALVPVLEEANRSLRTRALETSETDLQILDLLAALLDDGGVASIGEQDRRILEEALWSLLPEPVQLPESSVPAGGALYDSYRRRLGGPR